jgi:hypothetical protein
MRFRAFSVPHPALSATNADVYEKDSFLREKSRGNSISAGRTLVTMYQFDQ